MEDVKPLIKDLLRPAHFFVGKPLALEWEHREAEELPWEVLGGRLLDRGQCRQPRAFEAWNVYQLGAEGRSAEPLLAVKLDTEARQLHVTRAIFCYAQEGYHAGDNVYLSRETQKWVRELVATIGLDRFPDADELRAEVRLRLFQAVVGVSRLPLTSIEAPLPQFSLGQLGYVFRKCDGEPSQSPQQLLRDGLSRDLTWLETVKLIELALRSTSRTELPEVANLIELRWHEIGYGHKEFFGALRTLFDEVALTPYTDFVATTMALLELLREKNWLGAEDCADFLSYLLRHLVRHLTAYDLITFHHQGANYPDALLLDAALKEYLALIDRDVRLFTGAASEDGSKRQRLRRRALRQAWLVRCFYDELPVPDAPTSLGEVVRILPPPHPRVPEEQILKPQRRQKRLYAADPITEHLTEPAKMVLRQAVQDLPHSHEMRELGMAIFLDRPLGTGKDPAEVDQTLLLSYETFSRTVAERRLQFLTEKPALITDKHFYEALQRSLRSLPVEGVPLPPAGTPERPATVSIHDARKVADDFLLLCTTRRSVEDFLAQFDFSPLAKRIGLDFLIPESRPLIVRGESEGTLAVFDSQMRKRMELAVDTSKGYESRRGGEYPAAGLRVLRVWAGQDLDEHRLEAEGIAVRPIP